ncbi:hypothetical protein LOC68_00880 [Blastopirellula sp. JC732]|uniref:Uncharacterized protein n=1 Tax=Blastopirellula sediminis TaxID=2894196 RepID=A0A9X1MH46_9BACT|nr:hypothetical protein [Blastopirellula sediminis]MCC9608260.1 hypothetical protein [Blastopirellula sediminis]MCC9626948.1 hypothetical protein [Blastopirellula sediminis]
MRLRDIHRAVAAATGESISRIGRLGFQLEMSLEELDQFEDVRNPQVVDWDELEAERYQRAYWGPSDASRAA